MVDQSKKVTKTFRIEIVMKDVTTEFKPGWGVGVLGYQDVTFVKTEAEFQSPRFLMALLDAERQALEGFINTRTTEIEGATDQSLIIPQIYRTE